MRENGNKNTKQNKDDNCGSENNYNDGEIVIGNEKNNLGDKSYIENKNKKQNIDDNRGSESNDVGKNNDDDGAIVINNEKKNLGDKSDIENENKKKIKMIIEAVKVVMLKKIMMITVKSVIQKTVLVIKVKVKIRTKIKIQIKMKKVKVSN